VRCVVPDLSECGCKVEAQCISIAPLAKCDCASRMSAHGSIKHAEGARLRLQTVRQEMNVESVHRRVGSGGLGGR